MIKKWLVTCQCGYIREVHLSMIVKATTARKAKIKAEKYWEKQGHKCIWIESCTEFKYYDVLLPQTVLDKALEAYVNR